MIISNEAIEWLDKNNLLEKAKENVENFKQIFQNCLDAEKEEILIVGDKGTETNKIAPIIAGSYFLAARELNLNAHLILQDTKAKGEKADEKVIKGLADLKQNNIAILSLSKKLGKMGNLGNSFRTFTKENFHKFISATNLGNLEKEKIKDVLEAMNVDYNQLQEKAMRIKNKLDNADEVRITTEAGTDLSVGIKGKKAIANAGDYKMQGTGGNIPAGEVYIPPKWKNVSGTVVIDGSSATKEGTILIKNPIKLTIENGEITDIEGKEEAEKLKATLDWACKKAKHPWGIRRIGELGIGINPKAKIIGATIVDEKTLGTAHIAIGSNHWFGGTIYAIIHLDQVFKNPKIYIDNELLEI
ncbi:aminopeptidase [Candidatus Woesearchaeota archaeon]|nr:aminopeptidase [Candidatus Woesearchaeota archaeon]